MSLFSSWIILRTSGVTSPTDLDDKKMMCFWSVTFILTAFVSQPLMFDIEHMPGPSPPRLPAQSNSCRGRGSEFKKLVDS
jgi:hypothetical protein